MRNLQIVSALAAAFVCSVFAQTSPYDRFFTDATMRVDYAHSGGPGGEVLVLDRIMAEGLWPGSRTRLIDSTNLGPYAFEVTDRESGRVIYSRGFGSIYGEWVTTAEARSTSRTFQESLRFPWPKAPVRVALLKRDAQNAFIHFWSVDIDPASPAAGRVDDAVPGHLWSLLESGPAATKVDVLLIGDGYTAEQLPKFHADASRLAGALFSYEPFKSRKSDFNVRGLDLPSETAGITHPGAGVFRRGPLSSQYDVFGLERYVLTYDNRALRDAAAVASYDVVEILVNERQYGGGGIFNLQGTVAVDSDQSANIFIHEFGHNLAALGDEYAGNVTYEINTTAKSEPWEPNITALLAPASLKWRDLVEPGTPLPTPVGYAGKVGAFEGAGYEAKGLYRPEVECIMGLTRSVGFCRVCQRAISRVIDDYSRP